MRCWCARPCGPCKGDTPRRAPIARGSTGLVPDVYVVRLPAEHRQPHRQGAGSARGLAAGASGGAGRGGRRARLGRLARWARSRIVAATRRAESLFRAALAADPRDLYTLGAYSDWLLDQGRPADVLTLVAGESRVDALLLRLALAQKALNMPEAGDSIRRLRARFAASRAAATSFTAAKRRATQLQLADDRQAALRLARENWNVQTEPADLRILAEAAARDRRQGGAGHRAAMARGTRASNTRR